MHAHARGRQAEFLDVCCVYACFARRLQLFRGACTQGSQRGALRPRIVRLLLQLPTHSCFAIVIRVVAEPIGTQSLLLGRRAACIASRTEVFPQCSTGDC